MDRKIVRDLALLRVATHSQDLSAEDDATMADGNWNREMKEQFEALRKAIAADIAERFEAGERRLREGLSKDLDARFGASEQRLIERIGSELDTRFQASEHRLTIVITEQLETAQRHLDGRMRVHTEELTDRFTKFAEGYGGTLEGIQRELKEFRSEWRTKADDTDRVLINHAGRLDAIEKTLSDR